MKNTNEFKVTALSLITSVVLAGCGDGYTGDNMSNRDSKTQYSNKMMGNMNNSTQYGNR